MRRHWHYYVQHLSPAVSCENKSYHQSHASLQSLRCHRTQGQCLSIFKSFRRWKIKTGKVQWNMKAFAPHQSCKQTFTCMAGVNCGLNSKKMQSCTWMHHPLLCHISRTSVLGSVHFSLVGRHCPNYMQCMQKSVQFAHFSMRNNNVKFCDIWYNY